MPLTSDANIKDRLTSWYDPIYSDGLYRKMNYVFGRPWEAKVGAGSGGQGSGGRFPDYADIVCDFVDTGSSRRILNTQFKAMAKTMYSHASPEFPQIPKHIGETRKQFWLSRAGGNGYASGEWSDEFSSAFLEGDALGVGFVELGLESNPDTGYQRLALRHSPTIHTIYDRTQSKLSRAKGVCFVKYLAPEIAFGLYGKSEMAKHVKPLSDQMRSTPLKVVRVFDYWDIGYGIAGKPGYCAPTHAIIPGDLTNAPILKEANAFNRLPWAWYTHFYGPGMRHPIGRIELQMGTQEAINELERHLREVVQKGTGIDLVDITMLHPDDVRRWRKGEKMSQIRLKNAIGSDKHPPVMRIQSQEVAAALLQLFAVYERQYNDDGNTTDYERGNMSAARRTATEAELLAQRTQDNGNWGAKQAVEMYIRAVDCGLDIARQFDRDPVTIDLWGNNITINDPNEPGSTFDQFMQQPSKIVIDADDLTYQDTMQKRRLRGEQLASYEPVLGMGFPIQQWLAEEITKNAGDDPSEVLGAGIPQQQQQGPITKVQDIIDSKMFQLMLPSEQAQFLEEIGIKPDPARTHGDGKPVQSEAPSPDPKVPSAGAKAKVKAKAKKSAAKN